MASLFSALTLCIIFMVIIELSNSEADFHGKRTRNKRIKSVTTPFRGKHRWIGKHAQLLTSKRSQQKNRIKQIGLTQVVAGPKLYKKHSKKQTRTKKIQSSKINKTKGRRIRPLFVKKVQKQKGLKKKSFSKKKKVTQLRKHTKRISKTGVKNIGRRKGLKVGTKGKKFLGTQITKFDSKKLLNEILVPRKDGMPVKPKLPLKSTHGSLNNEVQPVKLQIYEKNYSTTYNLPSSTYSSIHKYEPEIKKASFTIRPEDTPEIIEPLKTINTAKTSLSQMTTESYKTDTTTEMSNEIPTKSFLDTIFGPELAKRGREHFINNFIEPLDELSKKSTKAKIPTTTAETIRPKYPDNFFGLSPEAEKANYYIMNCAFYVNNTCYETTAPSTCHEFDWSGNCINVTHYLKYWDEKTNKDITIPPKNDIKTPKPGDFHLWDEYNRGIMRRCVVHKKGNGLIKDTCVEFNDLLKDMPRLSQKIIETQYGSYHGNGNKDDDRMLALDAIRDVLNGYGTCERVAEKLPFLQQYFIKYANPCLR